MILLPYTHDHPADTMRAVANYEHLRADVSGSDTAYWELLSKWWESDEPDLLIIEHDIGVTPAVIQELLDCKFSWCACWYPFEGGTIYGLGCTKFALEIREAVPDAFDRVARIGNEIHPRRHWCSLDIFLRMTLMNAGHQPCLHRSNQIRHLSTQRSHKGCLAEGGRVVVPGDEFRGVQAQNERLSREVREAMGDW
jgi:hypothetical protein